MFSGKGDKPSRRGNSLLGYAEKPVAQRRNLEDPRLALDKVTLSPASELNAVEKHRRARAKRERIDNPFLSELANRPLSSDSMDEASIEPAPVPIRRETFASAPTRPAIPSVLKQFEQIDAGLRMRQATSQKQTTPASVESDNHYAGFSPTIAQSAEWRPLIDPRYILDAVRNWRNLIILCGVLGTGLGIVQALSTTKLYYSTAEIKIDPRGKKVIDNGVNPDGYLSDTFAVVDSQLGIIRSPQVLEKVVAEEKLADDPEFNGDRKAGWIGAVLDIFNRGDVESDKARAAAEYLGDHLFVERGAKTYNVTITTSSEDAAKAAKIADRIVTVYVDEQRRQQSETVQQTSEELTAPLKDLKAKLEKAEKLVEDFKSENDLIGIDGRMIDDEAILRVNDQLSAAKGQTIAMNARAKSIKTVTLEGVVGGAMPEELNSSILNTLRSQYSSAKQKLDGLATKLGERHPERIQAESELASIKSSINAELRRVSSAMQTDLKRAVQTEQDLAARLAELKAGKGNQSASRIKLSQLQSDLDVKRSVYEAYLLRAGQTTEQIGLNTANITLIVPPRAAQNPVGTSRKLVVLGGLLGGLGLGLLLAIMKGIFDSLRSQMGAGGERPTARTVPAEPAPSDGGGGGMFQPRKPSSIVESVPNALPAMRQQSAPFAEAQLQAPVPVHAESAQPPQSVPHWLPQPVAPPQMAQTPMAYSQMAPAMAQPVQQWPAQPPMLYPQQMVQPGPMMYPQPVYPQQPAFVPQQQMPQPVWPQPQVMMPQPVQVQMPVYAQPLHPFAQEAQRPAPVPPAPIPRPVAVAPVQEQRHGYAPGDPRLIEIQESIEEFRSALTDFARRRRA